MKLHALLIAAIAVMAAALPLTDDRTAVVGMPMWIRELVLPGPELEVAPVDLETPVVVRIADAYPHGTAFRYDLVVYGLDPGTFDLRDYLVHRDGSPVDDLEPLTITIESVLPPGRVQPNRPDMSEAPPVGGYGTLLWVAGGVWFAGLWAILAVGRKKKVAEALESTRPETVADRLRPLVDRAVAGRLSRSERSQLELMLIAFWRTKLDLGSASTAEALTTLRSDEQAGPLLRQMEDWLHRPEPPGDVDVAGLLRPYQDELADPAT
jgi:hypothetical protein